MALFIVERVGAGFTVRPGENTLQAAASALTAAAWAEGTLPGGAGTKSAKEHAADSAASSASAAAAVTRTNPMLSDAKWNRGFSVATAVSFNADYTWTVGNSGSYIREVELTGAQLTATQLHCILDISSGAATITLQQYNVGTAIGSATAMAVADGQAFLTFTRDTNCTRVRFAVSTSAGQTINITPPRVGIGQASRARADRLLLAGEAWNAGAGSTEKPRRVMSNLVKTAGAGTTGSIATGGLTATLPQDTTHRFDVSLGETLLTTDTVLVMVKLSRFVATVQAAPLAVTTAGTFDTLSYFRDGWWYGTFTAVAGGNGATAARVTVTNSDFGGSAASVDVTVQSVMVFPRTSQLPALIETPGIIREAIDTALAGTRTWTKALVEQMGAGASATVYVVDPYTGSDSNSGLSEALAFRTVTKLRDTLEDAGSGLSTYACIRRGHYLQQTLDIVSYTGGAGSINQLLYIAFEAGSILEWLDPTQTTNAIGSRNNGIQIGEHPSNFLTVYGNGLIVKGFTGFTGNSVAGFGSSIAAYNIRSTKCQDGFTGHSDSDMFLYGCEADECTKACIENVGAGHTVAVGSTFTGKASATKGIISLPASESVTGAFTDCSFIAATADQTMDLNNGVTIDGGMLGDPTGFRVSVISTDNAYTIGGSQAPWKSNYTEALG